MDWLWARWTEKAKERKAESCMLFLNFGLVRIDYWIQPDEIHEVL